MEYGPYEYLTTACIWNFGIPSEYDKKCIYDVLTHIQKQLQ
jgi:hypothetical protein